MLSQQDFERLIDPTRACQEPPFTSFFSFPAVIHRGWHQQPRTTVPRSRSRVPDRRRGSSLTDACFRSFLGARANAAGASEGRRLERTTFRDVSFWSNVLQPRTARSVWNRRGTRLPSSCVRAPLHYCPLQFPALRLPLFLVIINHQLVAPEDSSLTFHRCSCVRVVLLRTEQHSPAAGSPAM